MKFTSNKKFTSWLLCMMLIVAMALTAGCGGKKSEEPPAQQVFEGGVMGKGQTVFDFVVDFNFGRRVARGMAGVQSGISLPVP